MTSLCDVIARTCAVVLIISKLIGAADYTSLSKIGGKNHYERKHAKTSAQCRHGMRDRFSSYTYSLTAQRNFNFDL